MKAIVQREYGPVDRVLHLGEVPRPEVGDDEVLVRVRAASVHPDVWHMVTGRPFVLRLMGAGLRRPAETIPGTDLAGTVEEVGRNVTAFSPGDDVFGESRRGMQWHNGGTYADYVAVPHDILALKPGNITFEQAAAVPTAGTIALHNFRIGGGVGPGQHVLINGAGGGVGTMAVQLARASGARVTGVDRPEKLEMVRSLGADRVVDYTREDFTRSGERYDLIFDVASTLSLSSIRRALTPTGTYVLIGHDHYGNDGRRVLGSLPRVFGLMALSPFVRQLPRPDFSTPRQGDAMASLTRSIEAGELTPFVDRSFPLGDVQDAMRYLAEGHARGKVVVVPMSS